ncbi:MAG: transketolase [Oligoflexia bacterium]|nr:transketolase [Oligoflexia bacterium]
MKSAKEKEQLDLLAINTLRFLSVDAIQAANSGHPGLPLGAAPMAYVLWSHFLRHNPKNPQWFNRDRFILSAGHGSTLLYSLLHLTGYDLSLDELKRFRQLGSLTAGHPEYKLTPGVEMTTGPLGQGFANGVGMAMAEAYLAARYNRPGFEVINHHTYALVSDGDLMEGVAAEAASLAGHLKLGKLIYLYDDNRITLSASTLLSFSEDKSMRFTAYGWHVQTVEDGNDTQAMSAAIQVARQEKERPSLIMIRTRIGYGSPSKQNSFHAHGSPLGVEEVKKTKENLGWPTTPLFHIPKEVEEYCQRFVDCGRQMEKEWSELYTAYAKAYPAEAAELQQLMDEKSRGSSGSSAIACEFPADPKGLSTRAASGKILNALAPKLPGLLGGSCDLNSSTFTEITNAGNFEHPLFATSGLDLQGSAEGGWNYSCRNIHFGVREHAMGSILNGMATYGSLRPFGATFLSFSDYMRPAIRLAALMHLPVIYVFTHDSVELGEDGPTHQPIEHLASLRSIPQLIVIRPCDANEVAVAWSLALETKDRPVALILTRQNIPTIDRKLYAPAEGLRRGGYVLATDENPQLILIATGSEASLIIAAKQQLQQQQQKLAVRVVLMPSWELFEAQTQEYRDSVLPPSVEARLAVEAGVSQGWGHYVGTKGDVISIDHFGESAPGPVLMREYGFTVDNVCKRALKLL